MDIWDLKRHFELAVGAVAPGSDVEPGPDSKGWVAKRDGEVWGQATAVEADAPNWAGALFGLEVRIVVGPPPVPRYVPLPSQPPVRRDLSLVLPGGATAASVAAVLRREGGALLERLDVLDEYRGPGLPAGTRGVTWRCTFRETSRTLTEREIDGLLSRMLRALEAELGIHRRES